MAFFHFFKKIIISLVLLPSMALACINDVDSRYLETKNFPEIRDLIMGKFPTHGKEWYEWRIKDRTEKIKKDPANLNLYDDLAIAYEKTGKSDKAIEILEEQRLKNPKRYETLANLGTVYIHAGQYQKGVDLLKEVMIINPQAHYGREKYQILLVEYLISKYPDGKFPFPISSGESNFYHFLAKQPNWPKNNSEAEYKELALALRGLFGMLRFGNSDSPILLEEISNLFQERANIGQKSHLPDQENFNNVFASMAMDKLKSQKSPEEIKSISNSHAYADRFYYFKDRVEEETQDAKKHVEEVRKFEKELLAKNDSKIDIEKIFNEKYYDTQSGQEVNDMFEGIADLNSSLPTIHKPSKSNFYWLEIICAFIIAIPAAIVRFKLKNYYKTRILDIYDVLIIFTLPITFLLSYASKDSFYFLGAMIIFSAFIIPIYFWQKYNNKKREQMVLSTSEF